MFVTRIELYDPVVLVVQLELSRKLQAPLMKSLINLAEDRAVGVDYTKTLKGGVTERGKRGQYGT